VTITHNHPDHNNSAGVAGKVTLVDGRPVTARQQMTAAGMTFTLIPGFHDNQNGALRGPNTMIRWTQAGLNIAHLGDLGQDNLTDAQLADLTNLDILFIAAGGVLTVAPERAFAYVQQLRPHIAIVMHYKTALGGPAQLADVATVAAAFATVVYKPSNVVVRQTSLPLQSEVWVMQPDAPASAANSATFSAGSPVGPGSLVSVFGQFTGSQTASAPGFPLPRKLGETELFVDGKAAPVLYVSPGQVNFQVPSATAAGQSVAEIRVGGQAVSRAVLTVAPAAPGIFVAANPDGKANSAASPAHPGDTIQIFATGVGAVTTPVDDGAAATAANSNVVMPNVFLQGVQLPVTYSGLAPGFAGLWQINVRLPVDAPTGPSLVLTVVSGLTSNILPLTVTR